MAVSDGDAPRMAWFRAMRCELSCMSWKVACCKIAHEVPNGRILATKPRTQPFDPDQSPFTLSHAVT